MAKKKTQTKTSKSTKVLIKSTEQNGVPINIYMDNNPLAPMLHIKIKDDYELRKKKK